LDRRLEVFRAFPDFTFEQEDLLVKGDRAVLIATVSGTDRGGFKPL
jgi:predicted ester cyclase